MCSSFMNGGNIFLDNGLDANVTRVANLDYSQDNYDSDPKRKEKRYGVSMANKIFCCFYSKVRINTDIFRITLTVN